MEILNTLTQGNMPLILIVLVILFGDKLPFLANLFKPKPATPSTPSLPSTILDAITTIFNACDECGGECCDTAKDSLSKALPTLLKHKHK